MYVVFSRVIISWDIFFGEGSFGFFSGRVHLGFFSGRVHLGIFSGRVLVGVFGGNKAGVESWRPTPLALIDQCTSAREP